jgi:hypothetical protein
MTISPNCLPPTCPAGQVLDPNLKCVTPGQYQQEVKCQTAINAELPLKEAALAISALAALPGPLQPYFKGVAIFDGAALLADQQYIKNNCQGFTPINFVPSQ